MERLTAVEIKAPGEWQIATVTEVKVSMSEETHVRRAAQETPIRILHLSDLHVGAEDDPISLLQPLMADLHDKNEGLGVERLDYLVISSQREIYPQLARLARQRRSSPDAGRQANRLLTGVDAALADHPAEERQDDRVLLHDVQQLALRGVDALGVPRDRPRSRDPGAGERLDQTFHWHWEIHPRLRVIAGLERATALAVNPAAPEYAAEVLRDRLHR